MIQTNTLHGHGQDLNGSDKSFNSQLVIKLGLDVDLKNIVVAMQCGFGYTLHEQLLGAGAQSIITTPMRLSLERRRKNDRLDATALCVRLSRHLDGHHHELKPLRIPFRPERERREHGRQREFWTRLSLDSNALRAKRCGCRPRLPP